MSINIMMNIVNKKNITLLVLCLSMNFFGQKKVKKSKRKIKAIKEFTYKKDKFTGEEYLYKYNTQGNCTNILYLKNDTVRIKSLYKYNKKGLLVYSEEYDGFDDYLRLMSKTETFYDQKDKVIKEVASSGRAGSLVNRDYFIYNENNLLKQINYFVDEEDQGRALYKYNDKEELIEFTYMLYKRTIDKYEFKYDRKGNMIKKTSFVEKKDKKPIKTIEQQINESLENEKKGWQDWEKKEIEKVEVYTYNKKKDIIFHVTEEKNKTKEEVKNIYEYDRYDNWIKCIVNFNGSYSKTLIREITYY